MEEVAHLVLPLQDLDPVGLELIHWTDVVGQIANSCLTESLQDQGADLLASIRVLRQLAVEDQTCAGPIELGPVLQTLRLSLLVGLDARSGVERHRKVR